MVVGLEGEGKRHPSTEHMMKMLRPNPNLPRPLFLISDDCWTLAYNMISNDPDGHGLKDSPELTAGLRKLLEAKDCFIRAALDLKPVDYRDR